MAFRNTKLHSPLVQVTGEPEAQRMTFPGLLLTVAWALARQPLRWIGCGWWPRWPTRQRSKELRSMSDFVKNANLGVKQHGIRACTLSQVAECRETENECGFPVAGENTKQEAMGQGVARER